MKPAGGGKGDGGPRQHSVLVPALAARQASHTHSAWKADCPGSSHEVVLLHLALCVPIDALHHLHRGRQG